MQSNEELIEHLQRTEQGSPAAADILEQLWTQNKGLVCRTVYKMTGLSDNDTIFEDILQQSFFGFHAAAYTYTAEKGTLFSTYFVRRIRWEICRYYDLHGYTVRVPAFMKQRIKKGRRRQQELEAETGKAVTFEAALSSLGLNPAAVSSTIEAAQKISTASLDSMNGDDDDGATLYNLLPGGDDPEAAAVEDLYQRELHEMLIAALHEVPADERGVVIRHYFSGVSLARQADERGVSRQSMYNKEQAAFKAIRAGKYGVQLLEFLPSIETMERAEKLVNQAREAAERLNLPDDERGLLIL